MTQQEYQRRRQALLAQMQPGSAALIFAAPEATRSADSEYPYRQSSDFWYFTGFNEPEAVLVLIKSDDTHNHSVLFNRVRDLTAEIWFGRRLGQDAAPEKLGVDRALAFSEINQQLFQLLNGLDVVYHAQGEYAYADEIVLAALEKLRKGSRQNLRKRLLSCAAPGKLARWRISARWKNAVRGCLSISWKEKFTTNLIATARAIPPITPLSAAAKMAVSCITLKTKVKCATAI